jgi:hypothetical protein
VTTPTIRRIVSTLAAATAFATATVVGGVATPAFADSFERDVIVNHLDWSQTDWGAEHQRTEADLHVLYRYDIDDTDGTVTRTPLSAYVSGDTQTWTDLWFAGFHASRQVSLGSKDQRTTYQTPWDRYGVNGKIPGPNNRTDSWQYGVDVNVALAAATKAGGAIRAESLHS